MTIKYADGKTIEGFILSRNDRTMRVAVEHEHAMVLTCVTGTWISEDSEPVEVEFDWKRHPRKEAISESDCMCSKELAARLIHVLLSGDEDECGNDDILEHRLAGLEFLQVMERAGHAVIHSVN